ncbi:MAG: 23S rRNA (cytosine1962-C5)-methyltransferase [Bacteroidia bacterium]|jgi:23S rRNA (cytosine1962-C5)-methyltransferase
MTKALYPKNWIDYELLDCGDQKKLERFGEYTLIRPEPQALWKPAYSEKEWMKRASASFSQQSSHKGKWEMPKDVKSPWQITYPLGKNTLAFQLKFTAFKHVGIFPEQADNWEFIYNQVQRIGPKCKVLNLFAYTGGASLAAKAAGADVVHVDSVRQVVNWAGINMDKSGLRDIRWVVEDALKFTQREKKRGHQYHGIILDPPAYGIGTNGERWKLEDSIDELLSLISEILHKTNHFLVLNTYSLGLSPLIIENLMRSNFRFAKHFESSELYLPSESGFNLPLGVVGRIQD